MDAKLANAYTKAIDALVALREAAYAVDAGEEWRRARDALEALGCDRDA